METAVVVEQPLALPERPQPHTHHGGEQQPKKETSQAFLSRFIKRHEAAARLQSVRDEVVKIARENKLKLARGLAIGALRFAAGPFDDMVMPFAQMLPHPTNGDTETTEVRDGVMPSLQKAPIHLSNQHEIHAGPPEK